MHSRAPFPFVFGVLAALLPAQEVPRHAALAAALDRQLAAQFPADEPGAAVLARIGDDVVLRRGYGLASVELGVAVEPGSVFCLGSVTKPITAIAVMALVEDGAVALDDPAAKHLPELELDPRITVEHLLSHRSGLPEPYGLEGFGPGDMIREVAPAELCATVRGRELRFEPGARHVYTNINYALLAQLVERVAGESWEAFLARRVFEPAGMEHTVYGGHRRIVPDAVTPYRLADDGWQRAEPLSYTRGYGLGGLFASVDDLAALDAALRSGRILQPATVVRMQTPPTLPDGSDSPYALGWRVVDLAGQRYVAHGGTIHGWRAFVVRVPVEEVFVAVLTNRDGARPQVSSVAMAAARQLVESAGR